LILVVSVMMAVALVTNLPRSARRASSGGCNPTQPSKQVGYSCLAVASLLGWLLMLGRCFTARLVIHAWLMLY
jgi:hypothetical protein